MPQPDEISGGALTAIAVRLSSGRVGSTLLMQLLATSDEIVFDRTYPYENAYLPYFIHVARQLGMPHDVSRDGTIYTLIDDINESRSAKAGAIPFEPLSVDRHDLQRRALRKLWEAFSGAAQNHADSGPSVRYYAEKLILGVDLRPAIEAGVPVVFIDLVRDPRDVLSSITAFNRVRGFPSFGRLPDQSDEEYLEFFIADQKRNLSGIELPYCGVQPISIRYEDMVMDLAGLAERLGSELQVSLDHVRVEAARSDNRKHMTSDGGAGSVGRWQDDLKPSEVAMIERELGPEMARLGYSV